MAAFTVALKKRARRLYDDGHGCNAIARQLDVTPSTISKWAKDNGLAFDRSQTAMAVRAHTIDLRADALVLAQESIVAARDALHALDGKYLVWNFGGKSNTYREHYLDHPPAEVVRNAVVTAGIAIDKALKITATQKDDGTVEVHSVLDTLAAGFARAAASYTPTADDLDP